jgi:glycosyltransferase involved in cell wall biosynthesis
MTIEQSADARTNGHARSWLEVATPSATALAPAEPPQPRVTVLIPTLNEEQNIRWVIERVPAHVDEVLLVDRSTDGTVEAATEARPDVRVVTQRGRGKGDALRTGFAHATGDYIVVLDADGSMDPGEIDYYVAALDDGYDFAKGSRFLRGGGSLDLTRIRTLGNRALLSTVNRMWRVGFTDLCYGYFAFRRNRLRDLAPMATGFEIEAELIVRALTARLRIAEVPSVELARQYGVSNLHAWRDGNRILRTVLKERLNMAPRRVVASLDYGVIQELIYRGTSPSGQLPGLDMETSPDVA